MIIGGQAVLLYGEPRLTKDIDVTLGIGVEELNRLKAIVHRMGLEVLIKDEVQFVEKTMVLPTRERRSGIRVDLIFSFSPYAMEAIGRARDIWLGKSNVKVSVTRRCDHPQGNCRQAERPGGCKNHPVKKSGIGF